MRSLSAALTTAQKAASGTPYIKATLESLGLQVCPCELAWTASANVTSTAYYTTRYEGDFMAKHAIAAAFGTGLASYEDIVSKNLSAYTHLSLWILSSIALAAADISILLDNSAGCGTPLETLSCPAIAANTPTRVHLTLSNPAALTAIVSVGLQVNVDKGACDIYLDDIRATKVYSFTNTGDTNRIYSIPYHYESPYGEASVESESGAAQLVLANEDEYFNNLDLRGYKVWLEYGFDSEASPTAPLWVRHQRIRSEQGVLICELTCIDIWQILYYYKVIGYGLRIYGTITANFFQGEAVVGGTSGAKAHVLSQDTAAGYILVTGVEGTFSAGETVTGLQSTTTVINVTSTSVSGGPSPRWDRDLEIDHIVQSLVAGVVVVSDMSADCDTDNLCTTYAPEIVSQVNDPVRDLLAKTMSMTKCSLLMKYDRLYSRYLSDAGAGNYEYTYEQPVSTEHDFFINVWGQGLVIPNRVIFLNTLPSECGTTEEFDGSADDAASVAAFGPVPNVYGDDTIRSDAEAAARASAMVLRLKNQQHQGEMLVPMNCGQEVFDSIRVLDTRMNKTIYGRVGIIRRRYIPAQNIYDLYMSLGGVTTAYDADLTRLKKWEDTPLLLNTVRHFGGQTGQMWLWYAESLDGIGQGTKGNATISIPSPGDPVTLDTGAAGDAASAAYLYKRIIYSAAQQTWAKIKRFNTSIYFDKNANQRFSILLGGGAQYVGFTQGVESPGGDKIYGVCSDGGGQTYTTSYVSLTAPDTLELEALFVPGKYTEFWIDGVFLGRVTGNIPTGTSNADYFMIVNIAVISVNEANRIIKVQNWLFVDDK